MADAKTTLEIIIAATDTSAGVFTGVGNLISDLSGAAQDVTAPFASLAKGVLAVDAALIALTGGGLALAVQASGKFSGQFAEITTIIDGTAGQIGTFRDDILTYAEDSTKSIDEINAAVYEAISTGVKYEDSLAFVRTAEELAVGGKASLADTTKVLISSLNAYGESTDKATDYSDALFVAVKYGATTMPELANSLSMVTNIAATSGVSFDELLSAIAALTATGMPTSQAIESLRSTLANVIKPSQTATETAAELGLQFDAAALKSKGLAGFLLDLNAKTGGNIATTSKLIGDVTGLNAAMTLGGNAAGIFATTIEAMGKKAGATADAYQKMVEEFDQINQKLANNVDTVLISVGDKIKDEYAGLVGSLTTILKAMNTAIDSGAFDGLFTVIEDAMKEASKYLNGIAAALPKVLEGIDFSKFANALGGVGNAIKGLFGGLDLTKPEDLKKVIQQVVDSLESLTRFTAGMIDSLRPFFAAIQQGIDKFNALDDETKKSMGGITGFMGAINGVMGPVDTLGKAVSGLGTAIELAAGASMVKFVAGLIGGGGVKASAEATKDAFVVLSKNWESMAEVTKAGIDTGWVDKFKGKIDGLLPSIGSVGTALGKAGLIGGTAAGGYAIGTGINGLIDGMTTLLTDGKADSFGGWLYDITHASEEAGAAVDLAGKRIKVLAQPVGEAGDAAQGAAVAFSENTQKLLDNAAAAGRTEEMQKILAGQAKELGMVYNTTTGMFEKATTAADVNIESFRDLKTGVIDLTAYYNALGRKDSGPIATTTKALDEAAKQSKETETKMLELASNEKIKSMEFAFNLQIATLEADTKRVEAAFDSINTGIQSTGETMSSLWGTLASGGLDFASKWELQDTLEAEEKRRQGLFDQQKGLVEAQTRLAKLQADRLANGGNVFEFKITGGSPTAQYLFTELFKEAQIYASGEGGALLLGIP